MSIHKPKKLCTTPMTRREYYNNRGMEMPENERGDDKGFLVENWFGDSCNIRFSDKDVFSAPYYPDFPDGYTMNFGHALEAMKDGRRVRRKDWDDTEMMLLDGKIKVVFNSSFGPEEGPFCVDDILEDDWIIVE